MIEWQSENAVLICVLCARPDAICKDCPIGGDRVSAAEHLLEPVLLLCNNPNCPWIIYATKEEGDPL